MDGCPVCYRMPKTTPARSLRLLLYPQWRSEPSPQGISGLNQAMISLDAVPFLLAMVSGEMFGDLLFGHFGLLSAPTSDS